MECQAEAAALLPSFRELTSAGVVGRERNGSPSDGSTDGSQQSQVLWNIFTCTLFRLGWSDWRFSNQYAGRFSQLSPWKLHDSPCFICCSCRQRRRNRPPNWVKNSACLRLTPWFSSRSRLHTFADDAICKKRLMEVILWFPRNVNPSSRQQTKLFPPTNQPTAFSLTIRTRITWCWSSSTKIRHTVLINFFVQYASNLDN